MLSFRLKTGPTAFGKLYLQMCGEEIIHVEFEEWWKWETDHYLQCLFFFFFFNDYIREDKKQKRWLSFDA